MTKDVRNLKEKIHSKKSLEFITDNSFNTEIKIILARVLPIESRKQQRGETD